jgi:2-polyprenyl-6-methoxyphenol hydroxylase-like FAD-dependent oxidoreductase
LRLGIEPLLRQFGLAEGFQATIGVRHSGICLSWGDRKRFQPYGTDQNGGSHGFEVSRTVFDRLLLDLANEQGIKVRQPCAVDRVQLAQENEARLLTGAGPLSARIIVDATGRASWLSRRLGIARDARSPRQIARYGYAVEFCSGLDEALELVGDSRGWVLTRSPFWVCPATV